jgi:hypothetical protein
VRGQLAAVRAAARPTVTVPTDVRTTPRKLICVLAEASFVPGLGYTLTGPVAALADAHASPSTTIAVANASILDNAPPTIT